MQEGLLNHNLNILDFACGTGIFTVVTYYKILEEAKQNSLDINDIIKNHILKNVVANEIQEEPALIAKHCLERLLQHYNYQLNHNEKVQVNITNTLLLSQFGLFENNEIKDNKIQIIIGNPPYNVSSQNNFAYITDLIQPYKPNDDIKERKSGNIQDDYVKFIRFAENKIVNSKKGIIGIITNNGFIDNPTFRAMRNHLMQSFDKIYVIDLHGNARKCEKSPDGTIDQNVFEIMQGVCISFFVKNDKIKDKGIYHLDIFGKRDAKFKQISEVDLNKTQFNKINPVKPFYLFIPQNDKVTEQYNNFISLKDIFTEYNSGIATQRDNFTIDIDLDKLKNKIADLKNLDPEVVRQKYNLGKDGRDWKVSSAKQDVMQNKGTYAQISYKPFDTRYTYYTGNTKGFHAYPCMAIMKHVLNKYNVCLNFCRTVHSDFNNILVNTGLSDRSLFGHQSYISPLYLYQDDLFKDTQSKIPNFKPAFAKMVAKCFDNPTPEAVLGFIYASLHSPYYRKTYLQCLKVDFPKVNFDVSLSEFKRLSLIGNELIDAHLMKVIPNAEKEISYVLDNNIIESIIYSEAEQRLYFNKTSYFENIDKQVWNFKIGSQFVLKKYLTSRRGRDITNDLNHVSNIIRVVGFTISKMKDV